MGIKLWVLVQHKNKQEIIVVNIMAMIAGGILYRKYFNIFDVVQQ